jgi:hypothetical protein
MFTGRLGESGHAGASRPCRVSPLLVDPTRHRRLPAARSRSSSRRTRWTRAGRRGHRRLRARGTQSPSAWPTSRSRPRSSGRGRHTGPARLTCCGARRQIGGHAEGPSLEGCASWCGRYDCEHRVQDIVAGDAWRRHRRDGARGPGRAAAALAPPRTVARWSRKLTAPAGRRRRLRAGRSRRAHPGRRGRGMSLAGGRGPGRRARWSWPPSRPASRRTRCARRRRRAARAHRVARQVRDPSPARWRHDVRVAAARTAPTRSSTACSSEHRPRCWRSARGRFSRRARHASWGRGQRSSRRSAAARADIAPTASLRLRAVAAGESRYSRSPARWTWRPGGGGGRSRRGRRDAGAARGIPAARRPAGVLGQ